MKALSVFQDKHNEEDRIKFLFRVYDIDNDGVISAQELKQVLKKLVGQSMTELQLS